MINISLHGESQTEVDAPVEVVPHVFLAVELHSITWAEVEGDGDGGVEFIFESHHSVDAEFAEAGVVTGVGIVGIHIIIVAIQVSIVVEEAEIVAEAYAATNESVEAAADVALVEEVRVEFQSPRVMGVTFLAHTDGDFGAEVELDGEIVGNHGFVGECLHIAGGEAEAMRVWGLGIAAESGQDCKNCNKE